MSNRPHYYYKIAADTLTGEALQVFMKDCQKSDDQARQWASDHGVTNYYESPGGMAGGIAAVEFDDTVMSKEGWERIAAPDGRILWLPEENTELEASMYALPVVSEARLIAILHFKQRTSGKTGKPLPYTFGDATPVIFLHHGTWYTDVPYECHNEDTVPISEKEFYRRKMAATNEQQG